MKKQAKSLGIKVASGVSRKTDYLVIGENVGAKKIQSAQEFDVEVLSELDYLKLIN